MQLPGLRNTVQPAGQDITAFIKASTANLQRTVVGNSQAGSITYLGFDGTTGAWKLNRDPIEPDDVGKVVINSRGLFEGIIEWCNGSPLQKFSRPLLGVQHDEPVSEKMLPKPMSPQIYRTDRDGPTNVLGFLAKSLDDGTDLMFESGSMGGTKAVDAVAQQVLQGAAAFGELVHPVVVLAVTSYDGAYRTIFNPIFKVVGFIPDSRLGNEVPVTDKDVLVRPQASLSRQRREKGEAPAL